MASQILLVDDDRQFCQAVRSTLENNNFLFTVAHDGAQAWYYLESRSFSLLLLDLMLPDTDGLDLLAQLREKSTIPILVTSARQDQGDRMAALELGADGYLPKPFDLRELRARIAACLRRAGPPWSDQPSFNVMQAADIRLDVRSRRVWVDSQLINLTPKEFDLLQALMSRPGRIYRSHELLWRVWGYDGDIHTRTLSVHIGRLRKKIQNNGSHPQQIVTIPGVGYMLEEPVAAT